MEKAIVVAYDQNRAIGRDNGLPWGHQLPADLAHFRQLTTGGSIIMGRATFESIGSHPLPNRENIVVSHTPTGVNEVLTAVDLASAYALSRYRIFVVGGAAIYEAALNDVEILYATEIQAQFTDCDRFFPSLDPSQWTETHREQHSADGHNVYDYDFVEYHRTS